MPKNPKRLLPLLFITILLAACSASSGNAQENVSAGTGSGQNTLSGQALFERHGCIACHTIEPEQASGVGPSLIGVANRSAKIIASATYTGNAETVEDYLHESILEPDIYLVEGYAPLMPKTYAIAINQQELEDLVNYLVTFQE